MRSYSPATAAYFASRASFIGHLLMWFSPLNRTTGAREAIGFWTGDDHQDFTIGGATRRYFAAGSLIKMDPIRWQTGIKSRTQRVTFSQLAPEVLQVIHGYDARHAPIEIHRALFHPESDNLIDAPHLILRGFVDKAPVNTPAKGEAGSVPMEIATHGRALVRPVSRSRSDASLRQRAPADAFRQYASIADAVETPWGRQAAAKAFDPSVLGGAFAADSQGKT